MAVNQYVKKIVRLEFNMEVRDVLRFTKNKPVRTIQFFKKSEEYYAIESDAELIASQHMRSIGALKNDDSGKYVKISNALYISLVKDFLLYRKMSIETYEYEGGTWNKTVEASPGNVLPVIDLISADSDYINESTLLAISITDKSDNIFIEAASCDPTLYTIATTSFIESHSFCHFETLLNQVMPSEVYIASIPALYEKRVYDILDKFGIPYKLKTDVKNVETGDFPKNNATKVLLGTLKLTLSEFSHRKYSLSEFMTVDYSAASALNIFPDGPMSKGLPTSLYQLLNNCVTPMGSRLLQQNMQQPLLDADKINERFSRVEYFVNNNEFRLKVRSVIKSLPDISRLMKKFMMGKARLPDVVKLYDITKVIEKLDFFMEDDEPSLSEFTEILKDCFSDSMKVKNLIEQVIDFDALAQHIYRILPHFDESLGNINQKVDQIKEDMEKMKDKIASDISIESEKVKLERGTNDRFHFRISRNLEKYIRSDKSVTIIDTKKDGVKFTTSKFEDLNEELVSLESQYLSLQKDIEKRLLTTLSEYSPVFEKLSGCLSHVDFYSTLADVAVLNSYIRPQISKESNSIVLTQARHPLLEKHVTFIANDIEMVRGESSFIIISGPNSAGKSTLLKTTGCCVYLSHIGSFIPCDSASLPIIPSIHARVGAWDSIHMSTFTVEMTEMASILDSATRNSLVIVDELGRSTSCSDGFGLAWAISKRLSDLDCFTLFATHFHELCKLEATEKNVTNYHMDVDSEDSFRMKFTFVKGPFDDSFGIEAAERCGFNSSVMKSARQKVMELLLLDQQGSDDVIVHRSKDENAPYLKILRTLKQKDWKSISPEQTLIIIKEELQRFKQLKKENHFVDVKE